MAKANGLKDKKITIYTLTQGIDEYGDPTEVYKPIEEPMWAYVRQLSAREFYEARAVQSTEDMIFTINWREGITTKLFIAYKDKWYNITRVDTFEGYRQDLHLYATEATRPKDSEIVE